MIIVKILLLFKSLLQNLENQITTIIRKNHHCVNYEELYRHINN